MTYSGCEIYNWFEVLLFRYLWIESEPEQKKKDLWGRVREHSYSVDSRLWHLVISTYSPYKRFTEEELVHSFIPSYLFATAACRSLPYVRKSICVLVTPTKPFPGSRSSQRVFLRISDIHIQPWCISNIWISQNVQLVRLGSRWFRQGRGLRFVQRRYNQTIQLEIWNRCQ